MTPFFERKLSTGKDNLHNKTPLNHDRPYKITQKNHQ